MCILFAYKYNADVFISEFNAADYFLRSKSHMYGKKILYYLWKPKFSTMFIGPRTMTHAHICNKTTHTLNTAPALWLSWPYSLL